jgi:hypothetical protein
MWLAPLLSILLSLFILSKDKIKFINNVSRVLYALSVFITVTVVLGGIILYFMAKNDLGPFYVGVDQSWRPVCGVTVYCGNHTYGDGFTPVCGVNVICQGGDHRYDGRRG